MTLFCIVLVACFCYKPRSWGMWLSEKAFNPLIQRVSATSISLITVPPCHFFYDLRPLWKELFPYFLQSLILPLPAACSTPVGIFNKEISFVLDYEGHFENRSDSTNDFWNTSFVIYTPSLLGFFLHSLLLYLSNPSTVMHVILLAIGNEYANQRGTKANNWKQLKLWLKRQRKVDES